MRTSKQFGLIGGFLFFGLLLVFIMDDGADKRPVPVADTPARQGVFNPESFVLGNGMQVVVIPNHRVPVVTHMVWYKVGSADEPAGKSGIAHYLEHLMFKGTKTLKSGAFSEAVARNGGQENAFTSSDYTAYYQNVAKDRLELVMKMEADRMVNLTLTADIIEPERKVIQEERRQRTDNNPGSLLWEAMMASLYLNHPYKNPIIGWAHELETLSLEDIRGFYKRYYAPNNAILVVAGDITAKELKPLAEKYYGVIKPSDIGPRARPSEPPHLAERRLTLFDARVRQPSINRSYLAPSYGYGDTQYAYPLEVLAEIVGRGATSRLYRSLVIDQKVAVSAGLSYSPDQMGPGHLTFHGTPQPGGTVEAVETAMDGEIAKLLAEGVTDDEVARAKKRMLAEAVFARDSYRTPAQIFGAALAAGQTIDDVESWTDRISAVTAEQVNQAAKAVLVTQQSVTGFLLPKKPETAQ